MQTSSTPTPVHALGNDVQGVRLAGWRQRRHANVIGSAVGMIGGSSFIFLNLNRLPHGFRGPMLVLWAVALLAAACTAFLMPRWFSAPTPRSDRKWGWYVLGLAVMAGFVVAGFPVLAAIGRPALMPAVIVIGVGVHFIPLTRAFHSRLFLALGTLVAGIGILGLVAGLTVSDVFAPVSGAVAGLAILCVVAVGAWASRAQPGPTGAS